MAGKGSESPGNGHQQPLAYTINVGGGEQGQMCQNSWFA